MRPLSRWWIPSLALLAALIWAAAACSDNENPEDASESDTSASICVEGEEDCDDTVEATPGDNPTSAPSIEPCADTAACQERSIEIARRDLAAQLDVAPDTIVLVSSEPTQWPDACLGITGEGVVCAQVITPGFRIVLGSGGTEYEYHTDEGTRAVLLEPQPSP
jgi:hypothetical protein